MRKTANAVPHVPSNLPFTSLAHDRRELHRPRQLALRVRRLARRSLRLGLGDETLAAVNCAHATTFATRLDVAGNGQHFRSVADGAEHGEVPVGRRPRY